MTEEEFERAQLEIAIAESMLDRTSQSKFSSQELAYFSDLSIDEYKQGQSKLVSNGRSNDSKNTVSRSNASAKTSSSSVSFGTDAKNSTSRASASSGSQGTESKLPTSKPNSSSLSFLTSPLKALSSLAPASSAENCEVCREPCIYGAIITALGKKYHQECFRCNGCFNAISGQFAPRGVPPLPYHPECAVKLFNPVCCVCSDSIRDQYYKHPFFENEVYCFTHADISSCFSCGRKQPYASSGREKFADLNDGRLICGDCASTIIMESSEAQAIYAKIVDYMENWQGLEIPKGMRQVPVLAVDVQSLNENRAKNNTSGKGGICCGEGVVRGLTMSTLGEVRHMSGGSVTFNPRTGTFLPGPPHTVKIEQVRDVTAVLVLYGLPEELATSIIAHEAMHVWLKLNKQIPFHLDSKVEEGLCQVMSFKYLQHVGQQRATGKSDGMTEKEFQSWQQTELLRSYLCHQIESDKSAIYGDGFREALKGVNALGLHIVLECVRDTGALPSV